VTPTRLFLRPVRWKIRRLFAMLTGRKRITVTLQMSFSVSVQLKVLGDNIGKNGVRP